MIDEFAASNYIHIYNKCALLHTHADDYMKNLKLNVNTTNDINEFQNQKLINIKLYLFFKIFVKCIHNKHAIELDNSDDLNFKKYQS